MKKLLLGVLGAIVLAILGVLVVASMKPDIVHVERSRTMASEPKDVLSIASDYALFKAWSPWAGLDPDQVEALSDPTAGVGAWYSWKGNDKVGEGKMTITAIDDTRVSTRLEFLAPWESEADTAITAISEADGAKVTWSYDSKANFGAKVMGIFMDMDAMLGPDFEKGLASLEPIATQATADRKAAEAEAEAARVEAERAAEASANGGEQEDTVAGQ